MSSPRKYLPYPKDWRLPPVDADQLNDAHREAVKAGIRPEHVAQFFPEGPGKMRVPNSLTAMLHEPDMARTWLAFNGQLLFNSTLGDRLREVIVLRVAWCTRSPYEWAQHVRLSLRYGLTEEHAFAIADGANNPIWTPLEADLLTATDELLESYSFSDATWEKLSAQLEPAQLQELPFTVGAYLLLALVFNGMGIQMDEDYAGFVPPPLPTS